MSHVEEWGLQIPDKMDLKCSICGPEHKTERLVLVHLTDRILTDRIMTNDNFDRQNFDRQEF
jgi:hypothetical protein